jgi:hypothetical protein
MQLSKVLVYPNLQQYFFFNAHPDSALCLVSSDVKSGFHQLTSNCMYAARLCCFVNAAWDMAKLNCQSEFITEMTCLSCRHEVVPILGQLMLTLSVPAEQPVTHGWIEMNLYSMEGGRAHTLHNSALLLERCCSFTGFVRILSATLANCELNPVKL